MDQGRYLATAADCAGCHGTTFKGGDAIASPMGGIYASNITPDPKTGIGSWILEQFSDVLRKGQGPEDYIFPAMPYTSYTGLDDEQIRALYAYFMLGVEPVADEPPETNLSFPFVRPAMIAWNALFLDEGQPTGAIDVAGEREERGRLLVETLGHCTACHTPRGQLMQPLADRHLAGAMIGGWWPPNITPGGGGIGDWSDERLTAFLMTGHTDTAIAAGEMSKVVSRSLSKLPADDIGAIVAYLRAVPPVASQDPNGSKRREASEPVVVVEAVGETGWQEMLGHDTARGDILYQSACATCHGIDGNGSADLVHPSLHVVEGVTAPQGATLVQVIVHGVDRTIEDETVLMPGFRDSLDDARIASLANYIQATFDGVESSIEASQVKAILGGQLDTPWLIENALWLAITGIVVAALVLLLLIWGIVHVVVAATHRARDESVVRPRASSNGPTNAGSRQRRRHLAARAVVVAGGIALLSGCATDMSFLNAYGPVADEQRAHIFRIALVTAIVVVPVIVLAPIVAWRWRYRGGSSDYRPRWGFSWAVEVPLWGVPIAITATLMVLLLQSTLKLDPYAPIPAEAPPLKVQVIGYDWKWLFVYPEEGVASVGELVFPSNRPLAMDLTSATVMQSFHIPRLGSQVYAMAGMRTELHLLANGPGTFGGQNTQYNGEGFWRQKFAARAMSEAEYADWLAGVRAVGVPLDDDAQAALKVRGTKEELASALGVRPSGTPSGVVHFASAPAGFFDDVMADALGGVPGLRLAGTGTSPDRLVGLYCGPVPPDAPLPPEAALR